MSKVLRGILIGIGTLIIACGLVFAGIWIGRWSQGGFGWRIPSYIMMDRNARRVQVGTGSGPGMLQDQRGQGGGMMRGFGATNPTAIPLTVDQAYQAASDYLSGVNDPNLQIAEVMVFDNNAYVRVIEKSSGIGAFELLVDPVSQIAYPEYGPNRMWNLKYGGMNHLGMMSGGRGMLGSQASNFAPGVVTAKMPVDSAQALKFAQTYLDRAIPGTQTARDADAFYGYYTIDILQDGKTVGMLSANGFSGQVFLHTWHGTFIEEADY